MWQHTCYKKRHYEIFTAGYLHSFKYTCACSNFFSIRYYNRSDRYRYKSINSECHRMAVCIYGCVCVEWRIVASCWKTNKFHSCARQLARTITRKPSNFIFHSTSSTRSSCNICVQPTFFNKLRLQWEHSAQFKQSSDFLQCKVDDETNSYHSCKMDSRPSSTNSR